MLKNPYNISFKNGLLDEYTPMQSINTVDFPDVFLWGYDTEIHQPTSLDLNAEGFQSLLCLWLEGKGALWVKGKNALTCHSLSLTLILSDILKSQSSCHAPLPFLIFLTIVYFRKSYC